MPLHVSPEQQRQQTLHALLGLLLRLAAEQPLLLVMEDLHWVDPSTLEWLSLLVDQGPTARILALCTCRPDFNPPWTGRSHLTQMTLARLPQRQAIELTHQVAQGKALPVEVVAQIVAKTDGVPLFVEELTKTVLESGLLQEQEEHYALTEPLPPLAIPATLHDSLLARLDRLGAAKSLAQLGATLARVCLCPAPGRPRGTRRRYDGSCSSWWRRSCCTSGAATAGDIRLQARPDPGGGVSVIVAEYSTAAPSAHCAGARGTIFRPPRRSLSCWRTTTPRRVSGSKRWATGSGPGSAPSNVRPTRKRFSTWTRGLEVLATLPETPSGLSTSSTCNSSLGAAWGLAKAGLLGGGADLHPRACCAPRWATRRSFFRLCEAYSGSIATGEWQRRGSWGEQLVQLAQYAADPAHSLAAHDAFGATLFSLVNTPPPGRTLSMRSPY